MQAQTPREVVVSTLGDILDGPEFQQERTLWDEFLDWLDANFESVPVGGFDEVVRVLLVTGLVLLTLIYTVAWIRYLRRRARPVEAAMAASDAELERARSLYAEAEAARAAGRDRRALRGYLHALLLVLGRTGLAYRSAWTNRELLRRGSPTPEARALLSSLVERYEPKEFGREAVTEADLVLLEERCRDELERAGAPEIPRADHRALQGEVSA